MFESIINEFEDKKLVKSIIYSLKYSIEYLLGRIDKRKLILSPEYSPVKLNLPQGESFFGYYDRSPVSPDGRYCLIHITKHTTKLNPSCNRPISLILYDLETDKIIREWTVYAYNWQQGCKPQWIDNNSFIFNNYSNENKRFISVVYNIDDDCEKFIDFPAYDSCNEYFLTLNFSRLSLLRPDYGYRNIQHFTLNDSNDGIFFFRFGNPNLELLISIESLKGNKHVSSMDNADHKVNHIMISPSKDKFMFMHRWIKNGVKRDRLYVYDFPSSSLTLIADYGMVSHCFWKDDHHIIGYMNGPGERAGYYELSLSDNSISCLPKAIQNFGDGHPHIMGDQIIFDTYPIGANRYKSLYHFNIKTQALSLIGKFRESCGYENQSRCDLHPRLISERYVSVDSTHSGKRQFILLKCK